jgi:hypothetical protein
MIDTRVGVPSSQGYGASLSLAFLHSIVVVGAGAIALMWAARPNALSPRFYAGIALVFLATLVAAFFARLAGASTLREAWFDRPGAIGGVVVAAVLTAAVSTIVAVVLFGLGR